MSTTLEDRFILLLRDKLGDGVPQSDPVRDKSERVTDDCAPVDATLTSQTDASPVAGGHGFWRRLDALTGISTQRWRKVFLRRQRPTPDMIQALARMFPQHAFWLSSGITDAANGHIAPLTAQTFPERLYAEDTTATRYFRVSLTLLRALFEIGRVNPGDEKERMCAARRTCPLEHWHESPLGDTAYDIACSDEYMEAEKLWKARERGRQQRIDNITGRNHPRTKRRAAYAADKAESTSMVCIDVRSAHQNEWDIFYRPVETRPRKFARVCLTSRLPSCRKHRWIS
jgi:hypothetical protein